MTEDTGHGASWAQQDIADQLAKVVYGSTTPFERGGMDSYYRSKPVPHKIVGTDKVTDLTREELVEYWKGYNENDDFKNWG